MNWQPIDTAPKEDSEILVWDNGFVWMAYWEPEDGTWNVLGYNMVIDPSHWMPVPEGPEPEPEVTG